MSNNFITNSAENATLKKRLEKLILASQELKFLVGFFYFSGWQEIYKKLQITLQNGDFFCEFYSLNNSQFL